MTRGSTPAVAHPRMRAIGVSRVPGDAASPATTTAAPPSVMPDDEPAVMMPGAPSTSPKTSGSLLQGLERRAGTRVFVRRHRPTRPFGPCTVTGAISATKRPAAIAASARCWLLEGEAIRLLARDAVVAREDFGRLSHDQAESGHWKPSRYIASTSGKMPHLVAPSRVVRVEQVRHAAHRLDAAGEDDVGLAERDGLRRGGDRLQAGRAGLVQRPSRHAIRQAHAPSDLAAGVGAGAGLPAVTDDDEVDRVPGDAGAARVRPRPATAPSSAGCTLRRPPP